MYRHEVRHAVTPSIENSIIT